MTTTFSPTTPLDELMAALPDMDPSFFVLDRSLAPDPEHLTFAALLDHPDLDVDSANALLRTVLNLSPEPLSVAVPTLEARLIPVDRPLRAFVLASVPVIEILTHLHQIGRAS